MSLTEAVIDLTKSMKTATWEEILRVLRKMRYLRWPENKRLRERRWPKKGNEVP